MLSSHPVSQKDGPATAVRRYPRLLYSIPFTLHHLAAGGVRSSRGISLDISESGLGALVESRLQIGDTVEIQLPLPDRPLSAVAIVRHTSSLRSGFEFLGLTLEERARLAGVVGRA